ncbi:peptidoglycan recognition protein family protein [Streptomyces sp. NPDC002990]
MTPGAPSRITRRTVLTGALGFGAATAWPSTPASARATTAASAAASAASGPEIFGCEAWGARPAAEPVAILSTPPQRIIVHHTATTNVEDYSRERAFAVARAIQTYHMDTQGWIDTGQHFTVSRGAYVTEGRHHSLAELAAGYRQVRSAHCVGQNNQAVGIENEGTYTSVEPPARQYEALVALCAHVCRQYRLPPSEIHGHRDFNSTDCPGDRLYALLPRLRQDVAARLGQRLWPGTAPDLRDLWTGQAEYLPPGALDAEPAR